MARLAKLGLAIALLCLPASAQRIFGWCEQGGQRATTNGNQSANKVQGCASQVWLTTQVKPDGAAGPVLTFVGDSDAHIVRGLIAILFAVYSGKPARDILATDAVAVFEQLGLREHLTPQRSNGFRSMVDRIRADARAALAEAA